MAYSEINDLKKYLPRSVLFEGDTVANNPRAAAVSTLLIVDAGDFIALADEIIDAKLSSIFDVPLRKVNHGGQITYPPVIRNVSAMLAAHMIFQERLSGSEKMEGEFTNKLYNVAMQRLDNVANGEIRLRGQNSYTAHRTIKSDLFTRPPNPSTKDAQDSKM